MYSRTTALPFTVAPARTTPKPSIKQRFASWTTFFGIRSNDAFEMKSTTAFVVPVETSYPLAPRSQTRRTVRSATNGRWRQGRGVCRQHSNRAPPGGILCASWGESISRKPSGCDVCCHSSLTVTAYTNSKPRVTARMSDALAVTTTAPNPNDHTPPTSPTILSGGGMSDGLRSTSRGINRPTISIRNR